MSHPFADKLFVFIGNPARCSRQAARDALAAVGGVVTDRLTVFMHYAVAFPGAESTKVYEKAFERDKYGQIIMLNEEQFFDVLEGKAEPSEKKEPPRRSGVIISEAKDPEAFERDFEKVRKDFIDGKRVISVARHGLPMPDGGRMKADLRPVHNAIRVERFLTERTEQFRSKIAVTLETLKSKPINEKAIEKGVALFNAGHVEYEARDEAEYIAQVTDQGEMRGVMLKYTRDGSDIDSHSCGCAPSRRGGLVCKHIVAAVLTVQGRIVETKITIGKTATVTVTVDKTNTAKAVGSGSLDVFATPMMIALMERAACKVLADGLEEGQTSVGTAISVNHKAASPIGAKITATATIISVSGRKIEFELSATDENRAIGDGKHTRMLVDKKRFMERARQ
jgi:predicted thioesterase